MKRIFESIKQTAHLVWVIFEMVIIFAIIFFLLYAVLMMVKLSFGEHEVIKLEQPLALKMDHSLDMAAICMAANIYHESRGEPIAGQYAVAHVTMRRAKSDPNRICRVVTSQKQFSWVNDRPKRKQDQALMIAFDDPEEPESWALALEIAHKVLRGKVKDNTMGSNHYHAEYYKGKELKPKWIRADCMEKTTQIGGHIFYRCRNMY